MTGLELEEGTVIPVYSDLPPESIAPETSEFTLTDAAFALFRARDRLIIPFMVRQAHHERK
jgi:hypothetical protein